MVGGPGTVIHNLVIVLFLALFGCMDYTDFTNEIYIIWCYEAKIVDTMEKDWVFNDRALKAIFKSFIGKNIAVWCPDFFQVRR